MAGSDTNSCNNDEKDLDAITHVENIDKHTRMGIDHDDAVFYENFPPEARKKMLRKIDMRLVPLLSCLYLAAHIDRANIGNAKIEGLTSDLKLTGYQYNIALSIFFIPYILCEVPSNIILKKFERPSHYLGVLILAWGTVMTLTGVVQNYGGLVACRFILGIFEAGFFPGAVLLLTRWYMPQELQTRIAFFFCASALSGAFSGLLAYAIAKMSGVGGYRGWRWIFILEGLATVVLGAFCFLLLPDSPNLSTKWMNADEIRYMNIQTTIREGGKASEEKSQRFRWNDLKALLTDHRVYMQGWILFAQTCSSYGMKFTMPSITKSMGFTSSNAQLLTIPPYVLGAISSIVFAKLSDRHYWRMPFIVVPFLFLVIGFAIIFPLAATIKHHIAACYVGVCIICMGLYPINPAGSAWISSNLAGPSKRGMGIALNICLGNLGGIVGSYMFLDREAPAYPTGFGIGLAVSAAGVVNTLLLELSYHTANKSRAKMTEEEVHAKYTEEQLIKMGDKSPLFKYSL